MLAQAVALRGHFEVGLEQQTIAGYLAVTELGFAKEEAAMVSGSCERKTLSDGLAVLLEHLEVGSDMEVPAESPAVVDREMCMSPVVDTAAADLRHG
jgi:hypothetical protein